MKFLSFDTAGMEDEQVMILKQTYTALAGKYKIHFSKDGKKVENLLPMENAQVAGVLLLEKAGKKCFLIFIKMFPIVTAAHWTDREVNYKNFQVYALSQLRLNLGNVFIRRKNMIDKVLELFISVTLKFKNDLDFNRKFYVIADNKEETYPLMNDKFRRVMMMISNVNFLINVRGRNLMVESNDKLDVNMALLMADFANEISGL